jgi:HAD superfamily hydrolase (TIGR01509 family)
MKKILAVDAVECLVDYQGKINNDIKHLIDKFRIKKIILTNANDEEKKKFLKNVKYQIFSLKHQPNKTNPKYFKEFLSKHNLKPHQIIYFEHNIKAVKSAESVGIITHHYNGNLENLENFLNLFLDKEQNIPKKNEKNFHYYPQHPIVIGVSDKKISNFMPCVWNTALSYEPFMYGVSVKKDRFTNKILKKVKFFSINFLDFKNVRLIRSIGRSSGKLIDKTKEFRIKFSNGLNYNVPILSNAYLSFECEKKYEKNFGTHTLFVGKVKMIHTKNEIARKSILDTSKISPTLYLGADHYIGLDKKSLLNLKSLPFHKSYYFKNK